MAKFLLHTQTGKEIPYHPAIEKQSSYYKVVEEPDVDRPPPKRRGRSRKNAVSGKGRDMAGS